MPHDIFISYSRKNIDAVEPIKEELEKQGFSCWKDLEGIPSGIANFKKKVIPAIKETQVAFLFFLSAESQNSKYALREIGFAQNRAKKRVILIRFNDVELTDEFYFDYQDADIIDWRDHNQKGKLLTDLSNWKIVVKLIEEGNRLEEEGTDYVRAAECFRQAAQLGDKWACHHYGDLLFNGWCGVEKDVTAAFDYYLKADASNPWVQYNIGSCHLEFYSQTRSSDEATKAVEYLRKSAETGIPWACVKMGDCYRDGIGVSKDFAQAAAWYRRATKDHWAGDHGAAQWAELNLGHFYRNGQLGERNPEEALEWYRKSAARRGNAAKEAIIAAAEVYSELPEQLQNPGDIMPAAALGVFFNLRRVPAKGTQPAFWMGETQVTQSLWTAVMGNNPSQFKGDDFRPVEMVSWDDCQDFLKRINALDEIRISGLVFRLPTSDEWEHACRAGSTGKYCRLADGMEITDASIDRVAWFDGNSDGTTHPVGRKEPNAWGLYDMHGNVGEWTQTAGDDGKRMERGGSCLLPAEYCLSSGFCYEPPSLRIPNLGFRLCASDGN